MTLAIVLAFLAPATGGGRVQVLRSTGGIPPHVVGQFFEPLAFQQVASGQYFVFDRRAHTVFGLDKTRNSSWKIVQIGHEQGRIIQPSAFDAASDGTFVVADAPGNRERVQVFSTAGFLIGGFTLPGRAESRVTLGSLVLNGVGSLQFTGRSIVMSQPETGSLFTEYSLSGTPLQSFGSLRRTGQESDRSVHMALNSGFPLVNPRGGYYFVFQTGTPVFQKYDASGALLFERHIEGREIDELLATQPTEWPRRSRYGDAELPLVVPIIPAAAVDSGGNLWIALKVPYLYVYDRDGDKSRVVQLRGAGVITPTSLSFAPDDRLLVTPGGYEFDTRVPPADGRSDGDRTR